MVEKEGYRAPPSHQALFQATVRLTRVPAQSCDPLEKLVNLSGPLSTLLCEMGSSPAPTYCRGCPGRQRRPSMEPSAGAPCLSHPSQQARRPHTTQAEDRNGLN